MSETQAQKGKKNAAHSQERIECRFPDFLCIGAQKAGTTWLNSNLRRHPRIWLPPLKELHYFNSVHIKQHRKWTERHRRQKGEALLRRYMSKTDPSDYNYRHIARLADIIDGPLSDHWYGRMFALAPEEKICGEICPDYYVLPQQGIEHIKRLSPDVKIILSLRDPISRTWSHLRMMMKARGLQGNLAELERLLAGLDTVQRADYPTIIANWLKFIPRERLLILYMDDIAEQPSVVLEQVCAFLNLPYEAKFFKNVDESVHAGEAQEIPPEIEAFLKKQFESIYQRLAEDLPEFGRRWRESHYSR